MRQQKIGEVRIEVPYFHLRKWKNYPVSQEEAISILEAVKGELEEALESINKQLGEIDSP